MGTLTFQLLCLAVLATLAISEPQAPPAPSNEMYPMEMAEDNDVIENQSFEEAGPSYPDDEMPVNKRRLRFNKRRLRFQKKDDASLYERETRGPRLRFQKKNYAAEDYESDAVPNRYRFDKRRLRFQKKNSFDSEDYEREIRAPRLRFNKRRLRFQKKSTAGDSFDVERRGPRLRFQKRSPSVETAERVVGDHSRRKRSVEIGEPVSKRRVEMSINSALIALTDYIVAKKQRERKEYLADLRRRMEQAGKRSAPSTQEELLGNLLSEINADNI